MKNLVRCCYTDDTGNNSVVVEFENGLPRVGETVVFNGDPRIVTRVEYVVNRGPGRSWWSQSTTLYLS